MHATNPTPAADPWLERWLPLLRERTAGMPVLELGCGSGRDSATLTAAGLQVTGLDISADAIARACVRVPQALFLQRDLREDFPVSSGNVRVILASLSLHYFAWDDTCAILERIHATLPIGGIFVCRLNSTRDVHYGATGGTPIAEHFYVVRDKHKRFFDRTSVAALFSQDWQIHAMEEMTIGRYEKPKVVWEIVAERH